MNQYGNVLHFMCYNAPYAGNFIRSLVRLEARIKEDGREMVYVFESETADKKWAQELVSEGKNVYFLTGKRIKDLFLIYKLLKKHKVKIIHTHFTGVKYHCLFNFVRYFIKGKLFLITHLHRHYEKKKFIKRYLISIASNIDLFVGCGESASEHFRLLYNIQDERITYVNNAIDFSRLDDYESLNKSIFSINSTTRVILMFGYDYWVKGVDVAIDAISEIAQEQDVCLLLALSTNKDFVLKKILEKLNFLPNWIKILEPRNDIASYYHLSDIFISPSRSEGLCYSLVEAAYCKIPLIASDIPGQSSLNIPNVFQFPSEDVSKLKQQILTVLSLKEEEKTIIAKIQKEFVTKTYDLDVWAEKIIKTYKSLYS